MTTPKDVLTKMEIMDKLFYAFLVFDETQDIDKTYLINSRKLVLSQIDTKETFIKSIRTHGIPNSLGNVLIPQVVPDRVTITLSLW